MSHANYAANTEVNISFNLDNHIRTSIRDEWRQLVSSYGLEEVVAQAYVACDRTFYAFLDGLTKTVAALLTSELYKEEARRICPWRQVSIDDESEVEYTDDGLGAYVTARIWVPKDQIRHSTLGQQ
jgi:hypothetical protein